MQIENIQKNKRRRVIAPIYAVVKTDPELFEKSKGR
jgi:hypothetical protein